jgi:methenyltetrahydromethanopterin cyclohydrolase
VEEAVVKNMPLLNKNALEIVEELIDYSEEYRIEVKELSNGAVVVDCGVNAPGGYAAGVMYTQVCMGGLANIGISSQKLREHMLPFIEVSTDFPAISCLGSQKAGWQVKAGKYFAMGSGPARALARKPKKTYEQIGYGEEYDFAVIALESDKLPGAEAAEQVASECGVEPGNVIALVAPTASIVGSVQISGRIVETAVYKLAELGYDTTDILSATGCAPIAPVKKDSTVAMGTTNDSIIYHGSVYMTVKAMDDVFAQVPSENSKDYGKPFYVTFKDAGFDFYKIDPLIFAPARIVVNFLAEGETRAYGHLNSDVLLESYGIK